MHFVQWLAVMCSHWLPCSRLGRAYRGSSFTGTWEQFWLAALPAVTTDSYGYQR